MGEDIGAVFMAKCKLIIGLVIVWFLIAACGPNTTLTRTPLPLLSPGDQLATAHQYLVETGQAATPTPVLPTATSGAKQDIPVSPTLEPQVLETLPLPSTGGPIPDGAVARLGIGVITAAAFSPDGRYVMVGTSTGVYLYEVPTLALLWSQGLEGDIAGLDWMPHGDIVAAWVSNGKKVVGWDIPSGIKAFELEHSRPVSDVAWSPDGTKLAVGWGDTWQTATPDSKTSPRLTVWNVAGVTQVFTSEILLGADDLPDYLSPLRSIVWSPDSKLVAGAGMARIPGSTSDHPEDTAVVWNAESGHIQYYLPNPITNYVSFSPDGKTIATWTGDNGGDAPRGSGVAYLWDTATGKLRYALDNEGYYVYEIAWHPDGSNLVVASGTGNIGYWDAYTGKRIRTLDVSELFPGSVIWSRDGRHVLMAGASVYHSSQGRIILWDISQSDPVYSLDIPQTDWGLSAVLSPSGDLFGSYTTTGFTLQDFKTGKSLVGLVGMPKYILNAKLLWSVDGKSLESYLRTDFESLLATWNIEDRSAISAARLKFPNPISSSMEKSPDGKFIVTSEIETLGEWLAQSFKSTIVIKRASDNSEIARLDGPPTKTLRVAWSSDSDYFALGGGLGAVFMGDDLIQGWEENAVMICEVKSLTCRTMLGHTGAVVALAFSPDGQLLATSSADGTVIVWQVQP